MFDKAVGFIISYDETKYLVLFDPEKFDTIYYRIRCLVILKSGIIQFFSDSYAKIKTDLDDYLPIEKTLILHNVLILIKSVFHKNPNHYYYNIFLEKCLYQLAKKIMTTKFSVCIIMLRFGKIKVEREEFYGTKKRKFGMLMLAICLPQN